MDDREASRLEDRIEVYQEIIEVARDEKDRFFAAYSESEAIRWFYNAITTYCHNCIDEIREMIS